MSGEQEGQQGQPAEHPVMMKRTTPSISTLLAAPIIHSKLPPLPPVRHSTDGTVIAPGAQEEQQLWGSADGTAATQHEGPASVTNTSAAHSQHVAEELRQPQDPSVQQQDHLLLRQPAAAQAVVQPASHDDLPHLPSVLVPSSSQQQQGRDPVDKSIDQQHLGESSWVQKPRYTRSPKPSKDDQVAAAATDAASTAQTRWKSWRLQLLQLLDSPGTSWVLMMMTLFVIFQEDFKYAVLPPSADIGFEAVTLALLMLFLVEIGLSCLVRPHFFLSFYFWLDTIATVSLGFELPALRAALLLGATNEYVDLNAADSYLMAAGASALVSSKAGRAAKLVRLFRQLQLIRLFRQLEVRQRLKRALAAEDAALVGAADSAGEVQQHNLAEAEARVMAKYNTSHSRVGQRLSDLTMKRVITGILAMLIVLPALEITSGINGAETPLALGGLHMLHTQAVAGGSNTTAFKSSLQAFKDTIQFVIAGQRTGQLLYLVIANHTYVDSIEATQVSFHPNSTAHTGGARSQENKYRRYLEMQAATYSSWLCPVSSSAGDGSTTGLTPSTADGSHRVIVDAGAAASIARSSGQDEQTAMQDAGCEFLQSFVLVDVKWTLRAQSLYGIARTMFLASLLAVGAMLIHQDTYRLVLQPVQRMVERVKEMAEDPLMLAAVRISAAPHPAVNSNNGGVERVGSSVWDKAGSVGDLLDRPGVSKDVDSGDGVKQSRSSTRSSGGGRLGAIRFWPPIQVHAVAGDFDSNAGEAKPHINSRASLVMVAGVAARRLSAGVAAGMSAAGHVAARLRDQLARRTSDIKHLVVDGSEEEAAQGQYETRLLEQSIYKICALLAVGFGDAGAEIIAENIKKEGDLNPIVPGKKTVAVFGFCDIRRFTDTTEVLQEGVMEFVNTIAHLVHGAVSARGGAANKNIGDAFLLVWKLPKGLDDRDINLISGSGAAGSTHTSGAGGHPASRLKSATLNWPGLIDGNSSDEEDSPEGGKLALHTAAGFGRKSTTSSGPGTLQGTLSMVPGAEELSMQLNSVLQKDLTIKRATSGVLDLIGRGRQLGAGSPVAGNSAAGDAASGGSMTGPCRSESSSISGMKRAVLNLKSVKTMPLSVAAKTTIINTIADNALASFVVIQVAIAVSRLLKKYSNRADLNARMPGFMVQMGFGLHVGWAIEGAIGSEYKIDASYLSPNVNLASRLEAATKQYHVPLLLSGNFVSCLSPGVRAKVRQIDCVTVKGSNQPMGLFCYDLDLEAAKAAVAELAATHDEALYGPSASTGDQARQQSTNGSTSGRHAASSSALGAGLVPQAVRNSLAVLPDAAGAARSSVVVAAGHSTRASELAGHGIDEAELLLALDYEDDWVDNPVIAGSWGINWTFKDEFEEAFQYYVSGDWTAAKKGFEACLHPRTSSTGQQIEDGPSKTLLEVMAGYDYKAPADWHGVRELTEK